jgi:hypothetical protein
LLQETSSQNDINFPQRDDRRYDRHHNIHKRRNLIQNSSNGRRDM